MNPDPTDTEALLSGLRTGKVSPQELSLALARAIEERDPELRAFLCEPLRAERLCAQVWCGHDMGQFMDLRHSTAGWYE